MDRDPSSSPIVFEPSHQFRIRTEVRTSTLEGVGVGTFALAEAPKGTFLGMDFLHRTSILDHEELPDVAAELRKFCWRHVEHLWFRGFDAEHRGPCDYMNHSCEPNLLWHVGIYLAARDIHVGDEIFLDYRFLSDPSWSFKDVAGATVQGLEWRQSLIESCRRVMEVLQDSSEP